MRWHDEKFLIKIRISLQINSFTRSGIYRRDKLAIEYSYISVIISFSPFLPKNTSQYESKEKKKDKKSQENPE